MMKHIKIRNHDKGWELGDNIALHLLEIDSQGIVQRVIDLDGKGNVIDSAPSDQNPYGAIDHPPLSQESDWAEDQMSEQEFAKFWAKDRIE